MPITPFHFGLGAALHALAPRQVSFIGFCAANVLIDLESLYNLVQRREPVHAFFHSYLGASLAIPATLLLFLGARGFAGRCWLPDFFRWRSLMPRQIAIGAALGAWSHVLLDSVMHADIAPLAPFSSGNALLRIIPLDQLHLLCLALGFFGLVGVVLRRLVTRA